jgi:hypothetical protein
MGEDSSQPRAEGEVFIRKDYHRVFAVLQFGGKEYVERLPLQIEKYSDTTKRWYLDKVTERLIKRAGIKKVRTLKSINSKDKPVI